MDLESRYQRKLLPQHFTASAVTLHEDCVLLVHHPRLNAWVPPGGHIEPGELPEQAAVRETLEETGLQVEVISHTVPDTGNAESFILKSPLCLQQVKAFEGGQEIYHLDIVYLCRPVVSQPTNRLEATIRLPESIGRLPELKPGGGITSAKWVRLQDLGSLNVAPNVPEVIELALPCFNSLSIRSI